MVAIAVSGLLKNEPMVMDKLIGRVDRHAVKEINDRRDKEVPSRINTQTR